MTFIAKKHISQYFTIMIFNVLEHFMVFFFLNVQGKTYSDFIGIKEINLFL